MSSIYDYLGTLDGDEGGQAGGAQGGEVKPEQPASEKPEDISEQVRKTTKYVDLIGDYGKDISKSYEAEEKRARQIAKMKLIGDLANVAGQAFVATQGGRIFPKVESSAPTYYDRLAKLGDARRAVQLRGDELRVSAAMKDKEQADAIDAADKKRKQDREDAETQRKYQESQAEKQRKFQESQAEKQREFQAQEGKAERVQARQLADLSAQREHKRVNLVGSDGHMYYVDRALTDEEVKGLIASANPTQKEIESYTTKDLYDGIVKVDYIGLLAYLAQNRRVSEEQLQARGWQKGGYLREEEAKRAAETAEDEDEEEDLNITKK